DVAGGLGNHDDGSYHPRVHNRGRGHASGHRSVGVGGLSLSFSALRRTLGDGHGAPVANPAGRRRAGSTGVNPPLILLLMKPRHVATAVILMLAAAGGWWLLRD